MADSIEELVSLFKSFGITEYEAKVYISLLAQHPASAYTISQNSQVPHSRVYDVTRRLISRGIVASTSTKPEMFSPLSPRELVDKLQREYRHYTAELEKHLKEFDFHSDFDPVWNLTDPEKVFETTIRIIDEAQETIYIGLWEQEFRRLEKPLRAAHERGVIIFILLYGSAEPDFGTVYHHDTDNFPLLEEMGRSLDCTVDLSWCLTGRFGNREPCRVVWTRNKGLVHTVESYIRHDLYLAQIERDFGELIDEKYGRNLKELRMRFLG
jgi:sugar-specific transcriptional regulator TrmB